MTNVDRALLEEHAPWLLDPEFGVCVVGSSALRTACERAGVDAPEVADLDLSWALDIEAGTALLQDHDVFVETTVANQERGTLALKTDHTRIEITSFRSGAEEPPPATMEERILADLAARDMTVGALAHWLAEDRILDPFDGLSDWTAGRIVPVGDPTARIEEHPVRWLRYYRRAHQWGFRLDPAVRKVPLDPQLINEVPIEALASELRAALLHCRSPGRFLLELFECGLLQAFAPELARQFDGRPAGPVRHHPEVSQALHLILALEWIVDRTADLNERDRNMAIVAVLCHDLGKGYTPKRRFPAHTGHEQTGLGPLRELLQRLPGLTDSAGKRLAEVVCTLHQTARSLDSLRAGSRARLYDQHFRSKDFRADLFALAVGADTGGRLGLADTGDEMAVQIEADIEWMREQCEMVDAGSLWEVYKDDKERFRSELHQAWARRLSDRRA